MAAPLLRIADLSLDTRSGVCPLASTADTFSTVLTDASAGRCRDHARSFVPWPERPRSGLWNGRGLSARLCAAALILSGCTSMQPLQLQGHFPDDIHVGDQLEVITRDGKTTELKVTAVGADRLSGTTPGGATQEIAASAIASIQRREASKGKTVALGLGVAALAVLAAGAVVLLAVPAVPVGG